MIYAIVAAVVLAILLLVTYWCYRMAFYADRSIPQEEYPLPKGEIYEPFREKMIKWIQETRQMPHEDLEITSFDGLKLRGRYFEFSPDAPVELMFCKRVHELLPDSFTSFKNSSMFFSLRASNCFLTRLFSL